MEFLLILISLHGSASAPGSPAHVLQNPLVIGRFAKEDECLSAAVHNSKFPKSLNFPTTEPGYGAAQYLCVRSK